MRNWIRIVLSFSLFLIVALVFQNCSSSGMGKENLQSKANQTSDPENDQNGNQTVETEQNESDMTALSTKVHALTIVPPGKSSASFVRIVNTSSTVGTVTLTLFDRNGSRLNGAHPQYVFELSPKATEVFSSSRLAEIFGVLSSRGTLEITAPTSIRVLNLLRDDVGTLLNLSRNEYSSDLSRSAIVLPNVIINNNAGADVSYVRIFNPSDTEILSGVISILVYDQSGQFKGSYDLPKLAAHETLVLSGRKVDPTIQAIVDWTGELIGRASVKIVSSSKVALKAISLASTNDRSSTELSASAPRVALDGGVENTHIVENVPGSSVTQDFGFIRIHNSADTAEQVYVHAYGEKNGVFKKLGFFPETIAAHSTRVIPIIAAKRGDADYSLEDKVGVWNSRARVEVLDSGKPEKTIFVQTLFRSTGSIDGLSNVSCYNTHFDRGFFALPFSDNQQETAWLRVYNRSLNSINLNGRLYSASGELLARGTVATIPSQKPVVLSMDDVAHNLGISSWSARAYLEFENFNENDLTAAVFFRSIEGKVLSAQSCSANPH